MRSSARVSTSPAATNATSPTSTSSPRIPPMRSQRLKVPSFPVPTKTANPPVLMRSSQPRGNKYEATAFKMTVRNSPGGVAGVRPCTMCVAFHSTYGPQSKPFGCCGDGRTTCRQARPAGSGKTESSSRVRMSSHVRRMRTPPFRSHIES